MKFASTGLPVGGEVSDIDLSKKLDSAAVAQIQDGLNQYGVLVFRNQKINAEEHIAFTRYFGTPEKHILHKDYGLPGYPEVLLIGNVMENGRFVGVNDGGLKWHTDLSYKQRPTFYSFLYALEVPIGSDGQPKGDTWFVNTAFAFETLPEDKKHLARRLRGAHRYLDQYNERLKRKRELGESNDVRKELTPEQLAAIPDVYHPVARRHPKTGKECLYVNDWFTVGLDGMGETEGRALLQEFCQHCTRDQYVYRHKWQVGDLVVWDNVQTQHLATFDFDKTQRRLLQRTIIDGPVPV